MKNLGRMKRGWIVIIIVLIGVSILLVSQPVQANTSKKVAIIGSPTARGGGILPIMGRDFNDLPGITFDPLAPSAVNYGKLKSYDTVVLNVASPEMNCDTYTLSLMARNDLNLFVADGNKMIIYDSECDPAPKYDWLPAGFHFETNNPGARGSTGTLTVAEENTLSTSKKTDPYFIDTAFIGGKQEGGDANLMTTIEEKWCVDISGVNANGVSGAAHAYAKTDTDKGLYIYNGLDLDQIGIEKEPPPPTYGLRKIWVQELRQEFNPSNLPCRIPVALSIELIPDTDTNWLGLLHTVTATVTLSGSPQQDIPVTFFVIGGPNKDRTSTAMFPSSTDVDGQLSFTYGSTGLGTDEIIACLTSQPGKCSNTVEKTWIECPQVTFCPETRVDFISAVKFNDRNGDGLWNVGEDALPGWEIILENEMGPVDSKFTDDLGNVRFSDLEPGIYTVEEVLKPGWKQTAPITGFYKVYAAAGEPTQRVYFGNNRACLSIRGLNQIDVNSIVVLDSSNTCGFSPIIYLWEILVKPEGSKATLSDASAAQTKFVADLPGEYMIKLLIKDANTGAQADDEIIIRAVPITGKGTIRGTKFNDTNGNGKQDATEVGLANWTIRLDGKDTTTGTLVHQTATTAADGSYSFTGITPGSYIVCETPQPNWKPTTSACRFVKLGQGDSKMVNFGNRLSPSHLPKR